MKNYTYVCLDCGKEFNTIVYRRPSLRRCEDCGMKRLIAAITGLRRKEGPYYERWKKGMKLALRRL